MFLSEGFPNTPRQLCNKYMCAYACDVVIFVCPVHSVLVAIDSTEPPPDEDGIGLCGDFSS
jgi:hypothetical protein